MAFSSMGLIGPGRGPDVAVRGTSPRAIILQQEGGTVVVRAHHSEGHVLRELPVVENGTYDLPDCAFVSFEASEEAGPFVSCAILYERE